MRWALRIAGLVLLLGLLALAVRIVPAPAEDVTVIVSHELGALRESGLPESQSPGREAS